MTEENGTQPKVTVSLEQKVNLGNYESAGVGIILSSVPVGASAEEIDEMLDTGRVIFDRMRLRMKEKVAETRRLDRD